MSKNPRPVSPALKNLRASKDRRKSADSAKSAFVVPTVDGDIFPRRTIFVLAFMAAVLLGLLLWTAIVPDSLLFALA